jgi:S-disulfanyl-L-cysteine oxidoreductase SoxD
MPYKLLASALLAILASACGEPPKPATRAIDAKDSRQVELGAKVYAAHCAICHGAKLEGQPDWRTRLPNGRLKAPPHDDSGHTWHHPDAVLFAIVRNGMVPPYAPGDYASDMPAFGGKLSDDEIRAVLAYIASHWSQEVRGLRAEMVDKPSAK